MYAPVQMQLLDLSLPYSVSESDLWASKAIWQAIGNPIDFILDHQNIESSSDEIWIDDWCMLDTSFPAHDNLSYYFMDCILCVVKI